MGANLTFAMGGGEWLPPLSSVKVPGLCFISEMIERRPLVCCSCVTRTEYEGRS
jgi:hypothetical protein